MDPIGILRNSVRITLRTPKLWVLTVLLYAALLPALVLAGGFGAASAYLMEPALGFGGSGSFLSRIPLTGWIAYVLLTLVILTGTALLSWAIQAAAIRAADTAADGQPVSIRAALRLGGQRWKSLAKLALTFGVVIQALGLLPVVLMLALSRSPVAGAGSFSALQTILEPLTAVLGILIFLVTMSIAIEDLRPRDAMRRVWALLRGSWWGFLLAYILQGALALALVIVFAFLMTISVFLFLTGWYFHSTPDYVLGGAVCVLSSPIGFVFLTFIMVFSTVFFTLVYRAAAKKE